MVGSNTVACAFVGLLDTDGRVGENAAYSPAGTQFQECLLESLYGTGVDVTHIYALRPVTSFPRNRRLIFEATDVVMLGSIRTTLLGFVNFGPAKTLTAGLTLFIRLLGWAWREHGRPRAVLLYNVNSPPGIVSVLAGRISGFKVVAIVADLQVPGQGLLPDTSLRRLEFWLQTRTLPLCDGLIVLTRRMAEEFAPVVPFIWMEGALPNDLIAEPAISDGEEPDNDAGEGCVFMYAGGLSELKGVRLLLDAFARVRGTHELWITGRGPSAADVERAAKDDPRITYWGFPSEQELRALYQKCDVLINPHSAHHESAHYLFPSKLIEYLGTGKPVISTCSTPEVAEEYGEVLFLADDSPDALAATIESVAGLTAAEREVAGARGRRYVLGRKSWRIQGHRIATFISAQFPRTER